MKPGHHTYIDELGRLVAEWYDFGDSAPYESANQLIFDQGEQARISETLGANTVLPPPDLARIMAERFSTK